VKKVLRKAIAFMITLVMCLSMTNVSAYAEETAVAQESRTASVQGTWDGFTTENKYIGENYCVTFSLASYWEGGYNANVKIDNTGNSSIENWYLSFVLENNFSSIWNAEVVSNENGQYVVKNANWNADIPAGGCVEFGISVNENFAGFPSEYQMLGRFISLDTEDYIIACEMVSEWDDGFNANILLTNNTDAPIEEWYLEFDYNVEISNIWNATIVSNENSHFVVNNCGYNSIIKPGETITIGFTGRFLDVQNCLSNSVLHAFSYELMEHQDIYTVIFDCFATEVINAPAEQTILANELLEEPIAPSRVGYLFAGWYADELCTIRYDFTTPVTGNLTLYAKWQRINDNLNDEIIDLGDIEYLKSIGLIEVGYSTSGNISYIYGDFGNIKVDSIEDVATVLNASSSLWGNNFYASATEISVQTVGEGSELVSYYTYTPVVRNLPVIGSQIKLMVDSTGSIYALFSSYDERIASVNTTPTITQEQAIQIAFDSLLASDRVEEFINDSMEQIRTLYGEDAIDRTQLLENIKDSTTVSGSLGIQCSEEDVPKLVYAIHLNNSLAVDTDENPISLAYSETYLITANENAGQIIREISTKNSVVLTATDASNVSRNIEVTENGNQYRFIDSSRNIRTYKSTYTTKWLFFREYNFPGDLVVVNKGDSLDAKAVSVHANIEDVFDYYKNKLSHSSYDNQGAAVVITYDYEGMTDNAFWDAMKEQFVFTKTGEYFKAKDVVAHEYTHAVYESIVYSMNANSMYSNYFGETGSLFEAYADIMGNLIEGKTDGGQWTIAEDVGTVRDMTNPTAYAQVDHYSNIGSYVNSNYDNGGVHFVGGVMNKAAYLMMSDSRTSGVPSRKWAEVFYDSMYNLTDDATFLQARVSIIAAAKKKHFTGEQLQAIKDAFDAVGVVEQDSIRVVLTWGASPNDLDSHLVGPNASSTTRFHLFYGNRDIGATGTDYWQADLDYDDTSAFGPEVITIRQFVPGTYYFYVHNYSAGGSSNSLVLSYSGAKVQVYRGNEPTPINEFTVTKNQVGIYWNVFKLTIGSNNSINIETIDTYSNTVLYQ